MQNHYLPRRINEGSGSVAYWAKQKTPEMLIVFVHGFNGDATATWSSFPEVLLEQPVAAGVDIVFYGYDGTRTRSETNAGLLFQFLDTLLSDPKGYANTNHPALGRGAMGYKRVILVAHSMGAIVSRFAILQASGSRGWYDTVEMVSFAPADSGASVAPLFFQAFLGVGGAVTKVLGPVIKYYFAALQDVEPGCATLKILEDQVRERLRDADNSPLTVRRVVRGAEDKVVEPHRFLKDPFPVILPDRNHITACKPQDSSDQALMELLSVLERKR